MKLYVGVRTELDRRVLVTSTQREFADYRLSVERMDDRDGCEWGCDPGGAAQLALAILVDHLAGEEWGPRLARRFAERLITTLPANFWVLSEKEVAAVVARLTAEAV